jgi:Putative MetA-pathway of phenol degradation
MPPLGPGAIGPGRGLTEVSEASLDRPSRGRAAVPGMGVAALALILAAPAEARAQACCAGGLVLSPGRLQIHETALVGVLARATDITGSFDEKGRFVSPGGAIEGDFEQDVIATLRFLSDGQFTVILPVVETYRRQAPLSDAGGGVGDLQASVRWDFTYAGSSVRIPGIAVLGTLVLPTGLPVDQATHPLTSDSTGTGYVQAGLGVSLEQTFGKWLVNLTGSATFHDARTVMGTRTQLGPSFNAFTALGYSFEAGPVAAVSASYTGTLDAQADGQDEPSSARTQLRFALSGGYSIDDHWRLQASVFGDPPAAHFGQNQPAGVGASAVIFRVW